MPVRLAHPVLADSQGVHRQIFERQPLLQPRGGRADRHAHRRSHRIDRKLVWVIEVRRVRNIGCPGAGGWGAVSGAAAHRREIRGRQVVGVVEHRIGHRPKRCPEPEARGPFVAERDDEFAHVGADVFRCGASNRSRCGTCRRRAPRLRRTGYRCRGPRPQRCLKHSTSVRWYWLPVRRPHRARVNSNRLIDSPLRMGKVSAVSRWMAPRSDSSTISPPITDVTWVLVCVSISFSSTSGSKIAVDH